MATYPTTATNLGSAGGSSTEVLTAIVGPLNSQQTPHQLPPHHLGVLHGTRPSPPMFPPGNNPPLADAYTNGRAAYRRAFMYAPTPANVPTGKYIPPMTSSNYIHRVQARAVGTSALKAGLPSAAGLATKQVHGGHGDARRAMRRVRASGGPKRNKNAVGPR